MSANLDAMLRNAIEYVKANRKAEARRLLEQIVSLDQMNEQAWLWLSACVDSVEEQSICLENVLAINPNNQKALKGLQALQARSAPPADPFASSPFSAAPAADPFADSPFSSSPPQAPAAPTSVEWGKSSANPPASSSRTPAFSDEDYDAWLANLPLGTPSSVFTSTPPAESGPFSLPADQFADDLDAFDLGGVYTPPPRADQPSAPADSVSVSPFSYDDLPLDTDAYDSSSALFSALDDSDFDEPQVDLSLYEPPESLESHPFEEGEDAPLTPENILEAEEPPPPLPIAVPRPRFAPPSLFGGKKRVQVSAEPRQADPSDPFSLIPEEITAQSGFDWQSLRRLPPKLILLAALNAVAVIALIINLFS